jgi:hypothetical protein
MKPNELTCLLRSGHVRKGTTIARSAMHCVCCMCCSLARHESCGYSFRKGRPQRQAAQLCVVLATLAARTENKRHIVRVWPTRLVPARCRSAKMGSPTCLLTISFDLPRPCVRILVDRCRCGQVSSAETPATVFEAASASTSLHRIPRFSSLLGTAWQTVLGEFGPCLFSLGS